VCESEGEGEGEGEGESGEERGQLAEQHHFGIDITACLSKPSKTVVLYTDSEKRNDPSGRLWIKWSELEHHLAVDNPCLGLAFRACVTYDR
jgi:hypothetical protein